MSRLDSAFERFNKAIDRVEGALNDTAKAAKANGDAGHAPDPTMEGLRAERDQLALQLEQLRGDYADLRALTDEVETRVDTAIDNIRKMMRG